MDTRLGALRTGFERLWTDASGLYPAHREISLAFCGTTKGVVQYDDPGNERISVERATRGSSALVLSGRLGRGRPREGGRRNHGEVLPDFVRDCSPA